MTDAAPGPGGTKPPRRPRKEAYVKHLEECDDAGIHRVCLSDKLYNLRATNDDFDEVGADVWERFNTGPAEQEWYYCPLGDVFAGGPLADSGAGRAYQAQVRRLASALGQGHGRGANG